MSLLIFFVFKTTSLTITFFPKQLHKSFFLATFATQKAEIAQR